MAFHVRIALTGVHSDPARSVIAIGDTILVGATSNVVLTESVQKKYSEISYSLEESEEPKAPVKSATKPASNGHAKSEKAPQKTKPVVESYSDDDDESSEPEGSNDILEQVRSGDQVLKSSRLRSKAGQQQQKVTEMQERKDH